MKFRQLCIIAVMLFSGAMFTQAQTKKQSVDKQKSHSAYVVGFYNLENLFDTIDNPNKRDEEYLPNGANRWGTMKYTNKLNKMAHAISQFPKELAILGVSEIENVHVIEDLAKEPAIANRNFKCICPEGPDRRGVDVGLMYNPDLFKVTSVTSTPIVSSIPDFYTRNQLCVTGDLAGEEVSVIVLHWPSRWGGPKRSAPRRADAAKTTRLICDSLYAINPNARIIIMGDLNDDPIDDSVVKHLGAKGSLKDVKPGDIFNPNILMYKRGIGSLAYRNNWSLFDQVMVSQAFLKEGESSLKWVKSIIFNKDFLKQQDGPYKGYPLRTHAGGVWTNGYSDHFPSLIYLVKTTK